MKRTLLLLTALLLLPAVPAEAKVKNENPAYRSAGSSNRTPSPAAT